PAAQCVLLPWNVTVRATQGQTLTVTFHGSNTHWAAGLTRAALGGEVSVGGAGYGEMGPVTVLDATTASADVMVSPTAALEPRTARLFTPAQAGADAETVTLDGAFTVTPVTPPGAADANVKTLAGAAGQSGFADGAATQARFRRLSG